LSLDITAFPPDIICEFSGEGKTPQQNNNKECVPKVYQKYIKLTANRKIFQKIFTVGNAGEMS